MSLLLFPFSSLKLLGITDLEAYRNGEWFGNSSLEDGTEIFTYVTYNFSDLIDTLSFQLENGETLSFNNPTDLEARTIKDPVFGRCFEIKMKKNVVIVDIKFRRSIYIYINVPFQFMDSTSRTKIQANLNEDLFLDTNYEIIKNNFGKHCRKYSNTNFGGYDRCELIHQDRYIRAKYNCTVPYFSKKGDKICRGAIAKKAAQYLDTVRHTNTLCPDPCHNILTWFGYPIVTENLSYNGTGFVRLYFKNIIKVTQDFVSYDLLRFDKKK